MNLFSMVFLLRSCLVVMRLLELMFMSYVSGVLSRLKRSWSERLL